MTFLCFALLFRISKCNPVVIIRNFLGNTMKFRPVAKKTKVADKPADFFQDLRPRKIAALYDQQAQLLRDYADKAIRKPDVAIQGATGSGKTLVGLVLAEWRRRKFRERPVYLCPTRQLVYQVATFAQEQLGLSAHPFVGSKHKFPNDKKSSWLKGDILAISTYSALFNISPFFSNPNFVIVDDAHASDQYIGEFWTVRILKQDSAHRTLFNSLSDLLYEVIPADEYNRLCQVPQSASERYWVQLVPTPGVLKLESEIMSILDQVREDTDLYYKWRVLRGHIRATQLFISPDEIMFRPVIPPTGTHEPFCNANQRLYMSATLGRGGELERLSGRKNILRLPSPTGWDGHGVGRRFFIFPKASLDERETEAFVLNVIQKTDSQRALILTPNDRFAEYMKEAIKRNLPGYNIFSAKDIETSKKKFVETGKSVAVIANRYDGIDFPDEECRLLIISGRPSGKDLIERYLTEKLCARALYAERMRTRIIQAFGRCTRSAKDYAIVCVVGQGLMDDLYRSEWQKGLDRELQAEINFGAAQSQDQTVNGLLEFSESFLDQGEEWRDAEDGISALKEDVHEETPEALNELEESSKHEIDYINALWREDYFEAIDAAECVIESLSGGSELKGYRGMWHYLAGCAAYLFARNEGKDTRRAEEHFRTAHSIAKVRNLPFGNSGIGLNEETVSKDSQMDEMALQALETNLVEMGLTNRIKFSEAKNFILDNLQQDNAKKFEAGHVKLGELLGFDSQNSEESGAPDPRWLIGDMICFVFEDHIKEKDGKTITLDKARQAALHPNWVKKNINVLRDDSEIIPVLITNADVSSPECQTHLEGVVIWPLNEFRTWAKEALSTIHKLRVGLTGHGDVFWRNNAAFELKKIAATPSSLMKYLGDFSK